MSISDMEKHYRNKIISSSSTSSSSCCSITTIIIIIIIIMWDSSLQHYTCIAPVSPTEL